MVSEIPSSLILEVELRWNFCAEDVGELTDRGLFNQPAPVPVSSFPKFSYRFVVVSFGIAGKLS